MHRTRGHLAGALAASVAGAGVAVFFIGVPVGATAMGSKTVTVEFTSSGPSPSSAHVNAGDKVEFVNHVPQVSSVSDVPVLGVLGGLLGQVQSQGITVNGAAATPFDLPTYGSNVTLTYDQVTTANYSAQYQFTLLPLLGVPSSKTTTETGQVHVAAVPESAPPAAATQPDAGGMARQPDGSSGAASRAGAGSHPQAGPGLGSQVVPPAAAGSAANGGGSATNARPPVLSSSRSQAGDTVVDKGLPALSGSNSGNSVIDQVVTVPVSRHDGLGLPAVVAVILLAVVTAALVRTLITQRRMVPA
ncbi:MAG TPA: hypothetical protein VLJ59_09970 [Mycobacteriales bacterium]|nr:hypothetical protein [Mycobacteriales bacterium]